MAHQHSKRFQSGRFSYRSWGYGKGKGHDSDSQRIRIRKGKPIQGPEQRCASAVRNNQCGDSRTWSKDRYRSKRADDIKNSEFSKL